MAKNNNTHRQNNKQPEQKELKQEEKIIESEKENVVNDKQVNTNKLIDDVDKLDEQSLVKFFKGKSLEEVLDYIKRSRKYKDIGDSINRLLTHIDIPTISEENYIAHMHSFYILLKNIIEERDYDRFKLRFIIVLKILEKATEAGKVTELSFLKYDYKWKWGGAEYSKFSKLITLLYITNEKGIRNVKNVISIDRLLELFNPLVRENLSKFYNR